MITPAILTVTANPQTKVYGANDPSLTDTVGGLVDATVDGVAINDTAASVLTGSLARRSPVPSRVSKPAATPLPREHSRPTPTTRSTSRVTRSRLLRRR